MHGYKSPQPRKSITMKGICTRILVASLLFVACKKGGDGISSGDAYLQCPSDTALVKAKGNFGYMLLPTAFTPNRDGRNDVLRVVVTDPRVVRFMRIRISDSKATTLKTLYNLNDSWDGYNTGASSFYPAGSYRVDYDVTLHGGPGADSIFSGHTCVKLYGTGAGGCLQKQGDTTQDLFEDQLDLTTMNIVRSTAETFCP
jgi:hypothetical protein